MIKARPVAGDIALGEQLFTRQTCMACHTTSQDQPQKGPYLGNIAQTYKRPDPKLKAPVVDPMKPQIPRVPRAGLPLISMAEAKATDTSTQLASL